ncbi:MAG: hypothetical protein ACLP50_15945 [Solirubrobacteraceae bacterium]
MKIADANNDFVALDRTAADSSELGGVSPDAFFQGSGNVVSGAIPAPGAGAGPAQLLSLPGEIIVVSVALLPATDELQLQVHNNTGVLLPAVQHFDGDVSTTDTQLPANTSTPLPLGAAAEPHQTTIQIFPSDTAFPDVVTLIVSSDGGASPTVVAQSFSGGV